MSLQLINLGTVENNGTGDSLRAAGQKINENSARTATIHKMLYSESLPESFNPDFLILNSEIVSTDLSNKLSFSIPPNYYPYALKFINKSVSVIPSAALFLSDYETSVMSMNSILQDTSYVFPIPMFNVDMKYFIILSPNSLYFEISHNYTFEFSIFCHLI